MSELIVRDTEVKMEARRAVYDTKKKRAIIDALGSLTQAAAAKRLKTVTGWEKVTPQQLGRWKKSTDHKKKRSGPKPNLEFEEAVLDQLIFTTLEKIDGKERAKIEANVMYSNAILSRAARKVQESARFKDDSKVKPLKFTRPWIRGLLLRHALRRRRITASDKVHHPQPLPLPCPSPCSCHLHTHPTHTHLHSSSSGACGAGACGAGACGAGACGADACGAGACGAGAPFLMACLPGTSGAT